MVAPARAAAYMALRAILTRAANLGATLARTRDALSDPRDRALATDLVNGTLRWRGRIDYQLGHLSGRRLENLDPEVLDALRLGAYQLLYLDRVPASAIVNDSVQLVKAARFTSAAPFVNGVLRRLARERANLTWPSDLAVVHSHPAWLVARWVERYGVDVAERWLNFNNEPAALTLAVNRLKISRDELQEQLKREGVYTEPTGVAPHGLRVVEGRALATQAFRDGACVVQDESSQLIAELMAANAGQRVLDACAAPGGKTVALAAQVGVRGAVVATDVRRRRLHALTSTLERCGVSHARVVHIAESGLLPFGRESFDGVLVDAPCSGLGTLRRDPDIKWRRQPDELPRFAAVQQELLDRVAPMVRRGGRFVYSTCSSEPEENESVVSRFLAGHPEFELRPLATLDEVPAAIRALAAPGGFLQTDPARDGLEAFFGAVLQRRG